MRTNDLIEAYNILNVAKYNKLEDSDKIKIWKIVRVLKPIVTKFQEDMKDASEKFMQEFENFQENLQKARQYETAENKEEAEMTEDQYKAFIVDFISYNRLVNNTANDLASEEVNVDFEKLSEDAFGKLMASNDWTIEQTTKIDFIIQ